LIVDSRYYNAEYGLRGLPIMLYRIYLNVCRRLYNLYRRIVRQHHIYPYEIVEDSVEWILQNVILPVIWRGIFNPIAWWFILIPTAIFNGSRSFSPPLRVLVLVGLTLVAVLHLLGLSYFVIAASYIARNFSTFNMVEWSMTLESNPPFLGLKVPSPTVNRKFPPV
jgi:hypothetical protein